MLGFDALGRLALGQRREDQFLWLNAEAGAFVLAGQPAANPPSPVRPFNAAIAFRNLADAGTIAASSQELLLPALNLQSGHVSRRWRSLYTEAAAIADLGAVMEIDTVALLGMTVANGTARVRASLMDPSGEAGEQYDGGVVAVDRAYGSHIELFPAPVPARYVRIDVSDAGAAFVEAGRLFVGRRTQFVYNYAPGWQRTWIDRSVRTKTRGGQTMISRDNSYRTMELTFNFITEQQMIDVVEVIDRENGLRTDVLVIRNPASDNLARDTIWGLMTDVTPVGAPQVFDLFTKTFKIEERL